MMQNNMKEPAQILVAVIADLVVRRPLLANWRSIGIVRASLNENKADGMLLAHRNAKWFFSTVSFGALALLPSIVHLTWLAVPITNPFLTGGPLAAGFGLAAVLGKTRFHCTALGAVLTVLIWMAYWLMLAGGACCQTIN